MGPATVSRYAALGDLLASLGEPAYRLTQILDAVHRHGIVEFHAMTALPARLRARLSTEFGPSVLRLRPVARERAGQVEKLLFETPAGDRVETVLSRFASGFTSLCISSQVGCGLGCTFCATGRIGLVRNLTADEICDQVLDAWRRATVDSVAFMGMGEALANPHTFAALDTLTDQSRFGFAPRRITVSTVGFLPGLRRLVADHPSVTMTLSVHSPFEAERAELIPLQNRFGLDDCLAVLDEHVARTRRKTYLAYLLLADRNDTRDHALALAESVRRLSEPGLFHVSLIPYNRAAGAPADFRAPPESRVLRFLATLRSRGVSATRRQQFGRELEAACGQLHARYVAHRSSGGSPTIDTASEERG